MLTREELVQEMMSASLDPRLSDRFRGMLCQAAALLCDTNAANVKLVNRDAITIAASDSWKCELNDQKKGIQVAGTPEDYYKCGYGHGALWSIRTRARLHEDRPV